ncbi:hypothetical protein GF377_08535 [candidate division GN15 bacterium]|nr:hypothetical protein [candidate division GN15 bacterium]
MPSRKRPLQSALVALCLLVACTGVAQDQNAPITGDEYEQLLARQYVSAQEVLMTMYPEPAAYRVSGPILLREGEDWPFELPFARGPFIVCLTAGAFDSAGFRIIGSSQAEWSLVPFEAVGKASEDSALIPKIATVVAVTEEVEGHVGIPEYGLITLQQLRGIIWASWQVDPFSGEMQPYTQAVQTYFAQIDLGNLEASPPRAVDFGLPESVDLFAEPPDYVIPGYENYQNFLHSHAAINVDFASGILALVPSDSLFVAWSKAAPKAAYPNKEWPMLQREYKKFFDRGGEHGVMQTLTRTGFDTLAAGEYFFGVSPSGHIRMGRELLRAEVNRIEAETDQKVPRANHAFLFPGEPLLTAGAFFIEIEDDKPRITGINAQSGHYFYSNVSSTIREDITERSDDYFLTLAHFFKALDALEIPYHGVLVSKL